MRIKSRSIPSARSLGRVAIAAAAASLLLAGVLEAPAGAAAGPYTTTTTVTTSVAKAVTGQALTLTATVKAVGKGAPQPVGQVVFTVTGADSTTPICDAGDTVSVSSGTAQCTFGAGLLAASSPYSVSASYTDSVDSNFIASSGSLTQDIKPGPTTTAITSSNNPSVTGQAMSFTAAVAISGAASGTLAGSVTFGGGVVCDGGNTIAVSAGFAQCTISGGLLAAGSPFVVTATYGGDPNFAASTAKVKQVVGASPAVVTISASPDNCTGNLCTTVQGSPVVFTATASSAAPGSGTPTGSVVFTVIPAGGGAKTTLTCDGGNTVALSGGQATCTFAAGLRSYVYYTVTATLSDPNYQSASATLFENESLSSTATDVSAPKNITAGETFAVTATVTPVGSSVEPTGVVDITLCGANSNGNSGCQGGPAVVQPNGTATYVVGGGEYPGSYSIYASYLGDQNFYASNSKKKTMAIPKSPTSIAITSSENPSVDGDAVALTATLTAANGSAGSTLVGPPSGSLTFTITGPEGSYTCAGTYGNTIPLNNGQADEGVASCYLPVGTLTDSAAPLPTSYTVTVSYATDGDYGSSTGKLIQTVVPVVS